MSFSIKSHLTQLGLGESWRQSWLWRLWRLLSRWWLCCEGQEPLSLWTSVLLPTLHHVFKVWGFYFQCISANGRGKACTWGVSAKQNIQETPTVMACFSASVLWNRVEAFFFFSFFFLDMLKPAPRSFKPQNLCNTLSPSCSVILNLSLAVSFLGVSFKYNESSRNLRGTSTAGAAEKDYRHSVGFSTQFWSRSLVVETF